MTVTYVTQYLPTPPCGCGREVRQSMDNHKKNNAEANTNSKSNRTEFADDLTNCNNSTNNTTNNTNQKNNKNNK